MRLWIVTQKPLFRLINGRQHSGDTWLYRERHLIECFINKIKHYRRIFSRFEKLSSRYPGFLHFVGALIWLR
jgi:transposase